nr:unnamed protein product [Callosobruchus analis]CAI5841732.1 unnamed protein product [Callosobruchus analis]
MSPLNCISSGGLICSAIFQYSQIFVFRIQSLLCTHSSLLDFTGTYSTYHFTVAILRAATMLCMEITRHCRLLLYTVYLITPNITYIRRMYACNGDTWMLIVHCPQLPSTSRYSQHRQCCQVLPIFRYIHNIDHLVSQVRIFWW